MLPHLACIYIQQILLFTFNFSLFFNSNFDLVRKIKSLKGKDWLFVALNKLALYI